MAKSAAAPAKTKNKIAAPGKRKAATPAEKAGKSRVARALAKETAPDARADTKAARVLELVRRPDGATLSELMLATGWQKHSVRGFIAGTLRTKRQLPVISAKNAAGERCYTLEEE